MGKANVIYASFESCYFMEELPISPATQVSTPMITFLSHFMLKPLIPERLNLRFLHTSPKFDKLEALIKGSGWLIYAKKGFKSLFLWAGVKSPRIFVTLTKASPILVRSSIPFSPGYLASSKIAYSRQSRFMTISGAWNEQADKPWKQRKVIANWLGIHIIWSQIL